MSFGRNPFVPKAEAAELKAADAFDVATRERAYRDAAHLWDRAAEREKPGKRRDEYRQNAERNRALADGGEIDDGVGDGVGDGGGVGGGVGEETSGERTPDEIPAAFAKPDRSRLN